MPRPLLAVALIGVSKLLRIALPRLLAYERLHEHFLAHYHGLWPVDGSRRLAATAFAKAIPTTIASAEPSSSTHKATKSCIGSKPYRTTAPGRRSICRKNWMCEQPGADAP